MTALHLGVQGWVRSEIAGIAQHPLPRVDDAARLDAIGIDTIAQHRLAIAAEDAFAIVVSPADMEAMATVGDVVALIERKRAEVAA